MWVSNSFTCPINIWTECIVDIGHLDKGDVDVDSEHVVGQQAQEHQQGNLRMSCVC